MNGIGLKDDFDEALQRKLLKLGVRGVDEVFETNTYPNNQKLYVIFFNIHTDAGNLTIWIYNKQIEKWRFGAKVLMVLAQRFSQCIIVFCNVLR